MALLRRELGLEAKIWLLTAIVGLAAVVAYMTLVRPIGTGPSELDVPWWLVAGELRCRGALGRAPALPPEHPLAVARRASAGGRPAVPAGARARPRGTRGRLGGARVRPRDPDLQGLLQPRAVHARHVRGAVRGRGLRGRARPARPGCVALGLRRGVRRHARRRHLRRRGGDHRGGPARASAAHRHAAHELDRRAQQHMPRARDRRRGHGAPGRRPSARAAHGPADGGVPRVSLRAPPQLGARVPLRGDPHAVALLGDRARARGAARAHRLGVPRRRRRPGALLRRAEPLGPLLTQPRRAPPDARADRRAARREPAHARRAA